TFCPLGFRPVDDAAIAATVLGLIETDIRPMDPAAAVVLGQQQGSADRYRHRPTRGMNPLPYGTNNVLRRDVQADMERSWEMQDDLFTIEEEQTLGTPRAMPYQIRQFDQHPFPFGVTMGIVDYLEMIDIQQKQSTLVAMATEVGQGDFDLLHQGTAVPHSGQRVEVGQLLQAAAL